MWKFIVEWFDTKKAYQKKKQEAEFWKAKFHQAQHTIQNQKKYIQKLTEENYYSYESKE